MKTKLIKAAGILLAGTLVVATAYTNQTQGKEAGAADTRMNAGVDVSAGATSELVAGLDGDTDRSLVSGANGAVSEYLSDTGAVSPEISGTDVAVTALAQEPVTEDEFGYINLGIASVDGNLNVRKAPGTDADVVGKMQNNAGCEILGVEGEWTQIRSGKVEGYVKSEYLLNGDAARVKAQEVKQTVATVTTA